MTKDPFYPFHRELHDFADPAKFSLGNFGLWYNKLIPNIGPASDDKWCACAKNGEKNERTEFYKKVYDDMKKNSAVAKLLEKKHCFQMDYVRRMEQQGFLACAFTGTLDSALITGLGEAHPSETSLVLDHTLGIPYIPASGIKGMVRFSHSKGLLFDNDGHYTDIFVNEILKKGSPEFILDEANKETRIPLFFGGNAENSTNKSIDKRRGSVIFFDAYPVAVPELHSDIINPHYSQYYGDDNKPPGDYLDPVPVKFLTVAPETLFVFRFLFDPESAEHKDQFFKAVKNVLTKEGIGAKTAIGYGRFKQISEQSPKVLNDAFKEYLKTTLSEKEKQESEINDLILRINKVEKGNASIIDSLFSEWQSKTFMLKDTGIAKAFSTKVKEKKSCGNITKQYAVITEILGTRSEVETVVKTPAKEVLHKQLDSTIINKLEAIIQRGYCAKNEKNKILKKYKEDYRDLCSKIKKLSAKN